MRRGALSVIAAVLLVFGAGQAAHAQYAQSVTVVFNGDGTITVTLDNCVEGETVTFEFDGATATDICEDGSASVVFGLVASLPVNNIGTAVGSESGVLGEFLVEPAATAATPTQISSGGGLPATGSSGIDSTTTIALGLLAVGIGMSVVARVRRRSATA